MALSFAVLIEALTLAQMFVGFRTQDFVASVLPAAITAYTNDARSDNHLATVTWNETLATAARAKAEDMAKNGYFAHVSPDGTVPWSWIQKAGYRFQNAGENLAVNFTDSQDVVDAWMDSPTHRANLLGAGFTEIGVGMATGTYEGRESVFVVQYFAKPQQVIYVQVPAKVTTTSPKKIPGTPTVAAATTTNQGTTTVARISTTTIPARAEANPQVLAAETASPFALASFAPRSASSLVFLTIAAFFILLLGAAALFHQRLPRGSASIGALTVVVVVLGFAIANNKILAGTLLVPPEGQSASVYDAIPQDIPAVAGEQVKG